MMMRDGDGGASPKNEQMDMLVSWVRREADIISVIGRYVRLERAGQGYRAVCPFHADDVASLSVLPAYSAYHCFGCGARGDVFSFVMRAESVSFIEAVDRLVEMAGMDAGCLREGEADGRSAALAPVRDAVALVAGDTLVRAYHRGQKSRDRISDPRVRVVTVGGKSAEGLMYAAMDRRVACVVTELQDEAWADVERAVMMCRVAEAPALLLLRGTTTEPGTWERLHRLGTHLEVDVVQTSAGLQDILKLACRTPLATRRHRWGAGDEALSAIAELEGDRWRVETLGGLGARALGEPRVVEEYPPLALQPIGASERRAHGHAGRRRRTLGQSRIHTGFKAMDKVTRGARAGEVLLIAGPADSGKTRTALDAARRVGGGCPTTSVLIAAPGRRDADIVSELLTESAGLPKWRLVGGARELDELRRLMRATEETRQCNVVVAELDAATAAGFDDLVRAWRAHTPMRMRGEMPGLVVVDQVDDLAMRLDCRVDEVVRLLSELARGYCLVVLATLRVDADESDDDLPRCKGLRAVVRLAPKEDGEVCVRSARRYPRRG